MDTAADDNDTAAGQRLLAYRVGQLEKAVSEIRDAIKSIDRSLQVLSMVETPLKQAILSIESLEMRVRATELEIPALKLVRNWVIGGVFGVVGTIGSAAVAMVVRL